MHYSVETLTPLLQQEVHGIISRYYSATPAHVRLPPYNYSWDIYERLETADRTLTVTARDDDGVLCGFVMYLLMEHPHHKGYQIAHCDGLAVDHTKRSQGIGRMIYLVAETALIELGVQRVIHHARVVYNAEPLFPKLGFTLEELVYAKEIG